MPTAAVVAAAQCAVLLDDVKVAAVNPYRVKAQLVHRHRVFRRHLHSISPSSMYVHLQRALPAATRDAAYPGTQADRKQH